MQHWDPKAGFFRGNVWYFLQSAIGGPLKLKPLHTCYVHYQTENWLSHMAGIVSVKFYIFCSQQNKASKLGPLRATAHQSIKYSPNSYTYGVFPFDPLWDAMFQYTATCITLFTSAQAWHTNVKNSVAFRSPYSSENNIKLGTLSQNYRKNTHVFAATSKQVISRWRREDDGGLLRARMLSTLPEAVSSVPVAVAVARTWLAKGR